MVLGPVLADPGGLCVETWVETSSEGCCVSLGGLSRSLVSGGSLAGSLNAGAIRQDRTGIRVQGRFGVVYSATFWNDSQMVS